MSTNKLLKKRETIILTFQKNRLENALQMLLLFSFIVLNVYNINSQTAPNISYSTPQNYLLNTAITTLSPVNTGGSVPALNYKQVSTFAGNITGFLDATGTAAKMSGPLGMTMDTSGNVYFVDNNNHRIRKISPTGVVTTIAGNGAITWLGTLGDFEDNASGTSSSFSWPTGLVFDATNNCLYVADQFNFRIRKISLTGTYPVTTFAGSGTEISSDGTGTAASFKRPYGIAIDPSGTYLYVTDNTANKIRRVTISNKQVVTIAGSGTASTVDNANGTLATFNGPLGIAVDANAIYVGESGGNKIRKIALTATFAVTTFAGSGVEISVDGTGVLASFDNLFGITLDGAGNLFTTEWGGKIRKITPAGIVTTIAGSGTPSSLDGNGIAATFYKPSGIVINPTTGIGYVSEYGGDRIRKIELLGGYTISPPLPAGLSFDNTTGVITGTPTATNNGPISYAVTGTNYYGTSTSTVIITIGSVSALTTTAPNTITSTTAKSGGTITSNGGSAIITSGICWSTDPNPTISDSKTTNGALSGAFTGTMTGLTAYTYYHVRAYATNGIGTTYGSDVIFRSLIAPPNISYPLSGIFTINSPLMGINGTNTGGFTSGITSSVVSTLAGGTAGSANGSGTAAQFKNPYGVATDATGNVYVVDQNNNAIRKITPAGLVSTLAGGDGPGYNDGIGISAKFNGPKGIATDALGNIYVGDTGNHRIRKIDVLGNVTTMAGSGTAGFTDGAGTLAKFNSPCGIAIDVSGNIYVADYSNYSIRKIDASGNVTTIAGNGLSGFDDGSGTLAKFSAPFGITLDVSNNIYVTDSNIIRKITSAGLVTTISGSIIGTNDGEATLAQFNYPFGITTDLSGNVYVADTYNNRIRKISTAGIVSTVAGNIVGSTDGSDTAKFSQPTGIAFDSNRNLFVADLLNNKIRKITNSEGFSISPALPAGLTIGAYGFISGTPTVASVATNYTVTATNAGGISSFVISIKVIAVPKVSTTFYNTITQTTVNVGGNVTSDEGDAVTARGVCWNTSTNPTIENSITTVGAGIGTFTSAITGLTPSTLYYVRTYATNSVGTTYGNQIRFYTRAAAPNISYSGPQTYTKNIAIDTLTPSNTGGDAQNSGVTTMAGNCDVNGAANGQGVAATFNSPNAVAVSSNRDVYVSDSFNNKIRKITAAGIVSDFVSVVGPMGIAVDSFENVYVSDGSNVKKYAPNGTFTTIAEVMNLMTPMGLAVDAFDNVYVADKGHATIYKISSTGIISIVAGSGIGLRGSTDGLASTATFNAPTGVTVDASGTIYVADSDNFRIRKITTDGMVSTLAGSSNGFQNGTGSQAEFHSLDGITVDAFGNVYVADNGGNIRKITPQGVVTSLTAFYGGTGQHCINGPLETAFFHAPRGLTIDDTGTLFATDFLSHTIRKIVPNGYTVSPALPAGLVLNADGSITGTPEVGSVATDYTITANNNGGSSATTITITVLAPNTLAVVSTISSTSITTNSGTIAVIVSSDGGAAVTARGVCWSTATNPTIADDKTTDGTGIGNFSSAMTSLLPNTTYYIRSYATNLVGTKYGNQLSFTTVALVLPSLSSTVVTAITSTTAMSGGTITSDGGSAILTSGICWSTTSNPTISDSKTTDGTGTGIFTSAITGLSPLSTYYVRAYATNSAGTAYGNEISFTTFALPVVITRGPTTTGFPVITYTSAQCGGSIQSLGGSTQITKGIYYSESPTPTVINTISTIQTSGSTPLLYDTLLRNLKPNTTYYVRAYVSNEAGTGLGEIVSFTTKPLLFTASGMNESDFGQGYTKIVAGGNINNISLYSNLYFVPTAYGVCWSTNANSNPTITDASTIIGATTDELLEEPGQTYLNFERQLTGLTPNTTYYARSFAKNATEVTYGTLYSFDSYIGKPILTSSSSTNITTCSADLGGLISDASGGVMGIKGVIYSTNEQTVINGTSPNSIVGMSSITSTGIGSFSLNISNLLPNTTYYYKAYAYGSSPTIENIKLGWGDVKSFTTIAAVIPTIALSTVSVTNGLIRASSLGSSSSCGAPITEGGYCYSTSINPTVLNDVIPFYRTQFGFNDFITGNSHAFYINNYNPSQTYYIRSYAINTVGIAYSDNWVLAIVAPSNLTVSQPIVSGTVGVAMSSITVSNSGGVATSYSISPSLPNGLLFDSLLGTISGTPLALLDQTTFTITATNSAGSTSTTVSLTINNSIPTNLTSSQSSLSAVLGTMIVPITMSNSGGIITSYTINPSLPAGLNFNETTGTISGTPTALLLLTNYTITATNTIGSTTASFSLQVYTIPTWNGSEWINGPAVANAPAIIQGNYSPSSSFEIGELTIKNNAAVVIQSGYNLTINGKLTVESGSTLTLENNSNLLQTTNELNSGAISIKRNTAPLKLMDYVLWSSPLTGQQLQSYSTLTLSNRFYTYNSGTNVYNAIVNPTADTFTAGIGYLIRMPNDHPTTPTIWTGTFTGIPTNGAVNLAVTSGTYNAIGNPYPSTLNADAFIDVNGVTEALYFWRKTNNSANPSYATYTKAGGVGTANSADPLGLIPNGVIQVGQGFIAKATSAAFSFTNAMRNANNGNLFLRTKNEEKSRIWLNLSNASGFFSQVLVAYMDGATSGIDDAIDGHYFNDSQTALTSIINNEEFTIQGRSLPFNVSDIVQLGFKTETAGDFSLAIDHTDGLFAAGKKVFLKDNVNNTINDISAGSYVFTSAAGVFNSRFELVYQNTLGTVGNELESNTIVVYKQNESIKIEAGTQTIADIKVYDVSGRLLIERTNVNTNTALITVNGATEVLLVHVITQEGSVVIKKIIQ